MLADMIEYTGLAVVTSVCLAISWIDYYQHRIPNKIVAPLAAGTIAWIFLVGATSDALGRATTALVASVIVTIAALAMSLATNGIGMGDVKLIAPVALVLAWLGRTPSMIALIASASTAVLLSAAALAQGKGLNHQLPLAPTITVGLLAGVITYGINQ